MDNEDHHADENLIAHEGEEDESGSYNMMEHPFVVLSLSFSAEDYELKNRKRVDSKLEAEVILNLVPIGGWPVRIVLVNLGTRALASS